MSTKNVSDGLVEGAILYRPVYWLFRLDVLPFLVLYSLFFMLVLSNHDALVYAGLIALPILFALHLFLFLMAQWSVKIRCILGYQLVKDVKQAELVRIIAAQNAGADRLVKLASNSFFKEIVKINILGKSYGITRERMDFQKVIYSFDEDQDTFVRLDYPSSAPSSAFLNWRGHANTQSVGLSLMRWGANEYDIPVPNFLDLYLDHLVAPFFVFQVLCLFLWSLDDYWYYSVFTLLMLMFFEGMMCRQRQASLTMLRNMRRPPVRIYVFRTGSWVSVSSDTLVPGDVISLTATFIKRGGKQAVDDNVNIIPCDALLVRGSCVVNEAMLTGESVPQMKETLRTRGGAGGAGGDDCVELGSESHVEPQWKRHMVFSGTSLMIHTEKVDADNVGSPAAIPPLPSAPDGGCVAVVVRTGFGTSQGGLMRKILFATERVTGNSSETFYFIGVLVVFAVIAAAVVLHGGLGDEKRNKFRLVLHCIMIVTSVVPPELPMELSLAVTNSLAALARTLVYCTEPFRISYAGRLDTVCFDKTGTLTKDQMLLRGVCAPTETLLFGTGTASSIGEGEEELMLSDMPDSVREAVLEPGSSSDLLLSIMGACHDLMVPSAAVGMGTELIGDPLEVATMKASGFSFQSSMVSDGSTTIANELSGVELRVRAKYPFSSDLKRMSVIVDAVTTLGYSTPYGTSSSAGSSRKTFVFCKGAPEVLSAHLAAVPDYYNATYFYHMSRGRRVLALAYKVLPSSEAKNAKQSRSSVESGLIFAGFLIFDCDLKPDSRSVIRELKASAHQVVMITGDSVYTAADVARRLSMLKSADKDKEKKGEVMALIIHIVKAKSGGVELVWRQLGGGFSSEDEKQPDDINFDLKELSDLASEYSLCVVGLALDTLQKHSPAQFSDILRTLCPLVTIFARVSPAQKEAIVLALNAAGLYTLMCGDGTNDVGALKAAHVGVSIVNSPELERRIEGGSAHSAAGAAASTSKGAKKAKGASARERMARASLELQEQEQDPTIVKLGDASIASPFTARRTSIDSVLSVMRQGRCTLVTTVQVYKVLALNCLVSAYMMSALYLRGLKQGDTQMTATGLVIAALFFFLSQAKPVPGISSQRPTSSIFAKAVILSLLGQFIVHFASLLSVLYICEKYVAKDDFSLSADGKFQPNVVNSAVFLLSALMQVNNFVVNYRGHPFTQSIFENIYLWRSVQVLYALLLIVAGGQLEPLNDLLQMAPFPSPEFQAYLLGILVFNFAACYGVETVCQKLE